MSSASIIFLMFLFSTAVIIILAVFVAWFALYYQKKKANHTEKLIELKNNYEQEILLSQLEMQEQVLQHVSYEIHDNIGQSVSLLKLQLTMLDLDRKNDAKAIVDTVCTNIDHVIDDLRNLTRSLNPEHVQNAGLKASIDLLVEQLNKTGQFSVQYSFSGEYEALQHQKEIIIFRIIQESINNIIRHSGAKNIGIQVIVSSKELHVRINDDGKGFDASLTKQLPGGLRHMEKRAKLINSTLLIQSLPGKGTWVDLKVPATLNAI